MHGIWTRNDAFQQDKKVHAPHLHLHTRCTLPLGAPWHPVCNPLRPSPPPPSAPPSHPICAFSSPLLHLRVVRLFQLITRQIRDLDKRIINPRTSKCPAGNPATLALASSPIVACTLPE